MSSIPTDARALSSGDSLFFGNAVLLLSPLFDCSPSNADGQAIKAIQQSVQSFDSAFATNSSRSCPQNMSSPTKKVGAPKTPLATALFVFSFRRSLTD